MMTIAFVSGFLSMMTIAFVSGFLTMGALDYAWWRTRKKFGIKPIYHRVSEFITKVLK
jgi:hypothetical protein